MEETEIIIRKSDLPACNVVERDGATHVDCGSDWGTWNVRHVDRMRETALEYVAAWQAAEAWHSKQAVRRWDKRRDELALEYYRLRYNGVSNKAQGLIDRIVELEDAAK